METNIQLTNITRGLRLMPETLASKARFFATP
jgi:hypothetical protein